MLISDKASIYNHSDIEIGDNSRIDDFCIVSGKVTIGRNVHIAVFCNVIGSTEGVTLDDFSCLAYGCHFFAQSDDYTGRSLTNSTVLDKYKNEIKLPIYIKRHSVVGANTVILPRVTLEEGASIGAMSLVTKSTEPWTVYFGIPAKRLKNRKQELFELEQSYLLEQGYGE